MNFQLRSVGPPSGSGGTVAAVEVHGDVDATNSADLSNALRELASPALIVDISLVDYFDSAGFAMIDRLLGQAPIAVVISPGSVVRTAAELVSLPFYDNLIDAHASMRPAEQPSSASLAPAPGFYPPDACLLRPGWQRLAAGDAQPVEGIYHGDRPGDGAVLVFGEEAGRPRVDLVGHVLSLGQPGHCLGERQRGTLLLGVQVRLPPGGEQVDPPLSLAERTRVAGVQVQAESASVEHRGTDLDQFHQARVQARAGSGLLDQGVQPE
jgi:anti-sigma B factor antagonist